MTTAPRPTVADTVRLGWALNGDPTDALLTLRDRYGPVVDLGWRPRRYTLALSPEANQHILTDAPADFRWREAFQLLVPVNGETALVVSDGDDHARRRRIVQPAFHRRRITTYAAVMTEEADRTLASWPVGATVDAAASFREVIRRVVVRTLFGDPFAAREDDLVPPLERALAYVNRPPNRRLDLDLPGTAYRRALRARRRVDDLVFAEIARRRTEDDDADDILGWLIEAHDPGTATGDPLSDQEVRDQVVSLIAAGYDTTSSAMAWSVLELARHPEHVATIRDEVVAAGGARTLDGESMAALPFTRAFVDEVLRRHPPAMMSGRRVVHDTELHGYAVPAGTDLLYSPYVVHHLADQYRDPFTFRPTRWLDGHPDRDAPHPYAYVPFGGGARRCLGFAFATMELVLFTALTAARVDLRDAGPADPRPTGAVSMAPAGGVPVTVTAVH